MGAFSISHWLIVLAVVLVVFGPGRLSGIMGDLGKGIKGFREGLTEDEHASKPNPTERKPDES